MSFHLASSSEPTFPKAVSQTQLEACPRASFRNDNMAMCEPSGGAILVSGDRNQERRRVQTGG